MMALAIMPTGAQATSLSGVTGSTGPTGVKHYEYAFPDEYGSQPVRVYDIDNGFSQVEEWRLPEPAFKAPFRGAVVYAPEHRLYITYGGRKTGTENGSVMAVDLLTHAMIWNKALSTGVDSLTISHDGTKLYVPSGEFSGAGVHTIVRASDGAVLGTINTEGEGAHDDTMSADGRKLVLGDRYGSPYGYVYDTATEKVLPRIGPLVAPVRPNTIDGNDELLFTTATNYAGFQVSDISTAKVLWTEKFGECTNGNTCSHGISINPSSTEVAVFDSLHRSVEFWNVARAARGVAPTKVAEVPFAAGTGTGWVQHSWDGRYVFVGSSGDVIDTTTHKVVANLPGLQASRYSLEVDWEGSTAIDSTQREGVGRTFETLPKPPTVVTEAATAPTKTSATLHATVNPNGAEVSACSFEYGTTPSYGSSAACSSSPGSGTSPVAASAAISGLSERSTYHFRISATDAGGTSKGSDQTLRTLPAPHYRKNSLSEAGALAAGERLQVFAWGTLTLTPEAPSKATPVSCETASGGFVENPEGLAGGAGRGETQGYGAWGCASANCPSGLVEYPSGSRKFAEREALIVPGGGEGQSALDVGGSLPWRSELYEPALKKTRSESKGVVLVLACIAAKSVEGGAPLGDSDGDSPGLLSPATVCSATPVNVQTPLFVNGRQIGGPLSRLTFDDESGKLHCKGPGEKAGEEIEFTAAITGTVQIMTFEGLELVLVK